MSLKHKFKKNDEIQKPIKIKFPHFKDKVGNKYYLKEDNSFKNLDPAGIRLLLYFGDQRYGKDNLVYNYYEKKDFRQAGIKLKFDEVKKRIKQLESLGLIKINDEGFIAYNYLYDSVNKTNYVKLPSKLVELVSKKIVKRNEIKVLFALLLILYSDCSKGVKKMGTNKKRITSKQIAKITGITRRSVRRNLRKLKEKRIINYNPEKGKNKGNLYMIEYDEGGINQNSKEKHDKKRNDKKQIDTIKNKAKNTKKVSNRGNLSSLLNKAV